MQGTKKARSIETADAPLPKNERDPPLTPNLHVYSSPIDHVPEPVIVRLADSACFIKDIPSFKAGLESRYKQVILYEYGNHRPEGKPSNDTDERDRLFDAYVVAKGEEHQYKAIQKIAALVYMDLHGSAQISKSVVQSISERRNLALTTVQDHLKKFRQLGRGCRCLVDVLDYGCLFLYREKIISIW